LDSKGITVRNVEGAVELRVADTVNGHLRVRRVTNNVEIDLPNVPASRSGRANSFRPEDEDDSSQGRSRNYSLQLGAGGADIVISGIEGRVKVRGI
jgi:hypothetical protein